MQDETDACQHYKQRRQADQGQDRNGLLHFAALLLAVATVLAAGALRVIRAAGARLAISAAATALLLRAVAGIAADAGLSVSAAATALAVAGAAARERNSRQRGNANYCYQFAFHRMFLSRFTVRQDHPG